VTLVSRPPSSRAEIAAFNAIGWTYSLVGKTQLPYLGLKSNLVARRSEGLCGDHC
jgi:hypothetical protein